MDLKGWVEAMARRLVDRPDQVSVRVVEEDDADVAELTVAPEEMGRVIGRQGRTVQALRTLLDVAGDKQGRAYDLEILE
ncbi:MAG TPA: KH domain-containing protein [Candidatus Polarisedimenticolia bacterium]|nr:KH domain-containing protein [Candidatus Polarisedimenticolia bacterium]